MPVITLRDDVGLLAARLTLDDATASHAAADVFFMVVGHDRPDALVAQGVLAATDVAALEGLQRLIFDRDAEGLFIRDGVAIEQNGREVDPDEPLARYCAGGTCTLTVKAPQAASEPTQHEQLARYAHMLLLHQSAGANRLDVTKDYPALAGAIAEAERQGQLEVDVPTATYALTPIGRRTHQTWLDEAQELVKRFDVYGDVLVDGTDTASFDTGMGEDLRVPMFELAGIDPFRARFLLGLNDGEWNDKPLWWNDATDPAWYAEVFAPVEGAPSVDEVGRAKLERIREQAASYLRTQGSFH